ncbi:Hypothetical predicted protein [Lecanosticta acicola]|uniref:Wax synthase domain-containing protein n=1 Tax=Lecanosticta acicola TaxID=111012 RepID=A0AAI8Z8M1_9PEZI|nr:Hypothetical predicted protein [Lecanosticta acicola]
MAPPILPVLSFIAAGTLALAFRSKLTDWAVSLLGLALLVKIALDGVEGPVGEVWIFGMAVSGLVVKFWNYVLVLAPGDLQYSSTRSARRDSSRRVGQSAKKVKQAVSLAQSAWDRLLDGLDLMLCGRGIGRKFELRSLYRHHQAPPRAGIFVCQQIYGAAWRFLILDLLRYLLCKTPLASRTEHQLLRGPLDYGVLVTIAFGAFVWQWTRWRMEFQYQLACILGVSLGWGTPADWPPIFGSWKQAWSVRRCWSHAWHHNLRLQTEPPTNWFVRDVCGAQGKSAFAKYGRVAGVFLVACVIHMYGRLLAGADLRVDGNYFFGQCVLIVVEDWFQSMVYRNGWIGEDSKVGVWGGYVWTFVVQCWTIAWWTDELVRKGWLAEPVFNVSVVDVVVPWLQGQFGQKAY